MARPILQATLALMLGLFCFYNYLDGVQAQELKNVNSINEGSLPLQFEQPKWRIPREAGRKNANSRKNKETSNKKSEKEGKPKKLKRKSRQHNKKPNQKRIRSRKTNTNRRKQKKDDQRKKRKSKRNKKKSRKTRKNSRRNKKKSRENRRKKKTGKKSKQPKKMLTEVRKKSGQHKTKYISRWEARQGCDENALGQKIKDFIKISNQLRKVRRIKSACKLLENKANKAMTAFEATVAALNSSRGSSSESRMHLSTSRWKRSNSSDIENTEILDKLKNCSKTASAKCKKSSAEACQNETQLTTCETKLKDWMDKFGPAKGSCVHVTDCVCCCITALPDVPKDCLAFDKIDALAKTSKKKCTSSDEEGSFGFCKKLVGFAAEKKKGNCNCKMETTECMDTNPGIVTTRTSSFLRRKTRQPYRGSRGMCLCKSDCTLREGYPLTTISTLTFEFFISFYFKVTSYVRGWQHIIDLKTGGSCSGYGIKVPFVTLFHNSAIEVCFAVDNNGIGCKILKGINLEIKQWYYVEIKQEYKSITKVYQLQAKFASSIIGTLTYTRPALYNNLQMYGTLGCPLQGSIKNLTINAEAPIAPTDC